MSIVSTPATRFDIARSSLCAGIVGCTAPYPLNLMKTIQQMGQSKLVTNPTEYRIRHMARDLMATSGRGFAGLYRGYSVSALLYSQATIVHYSMYYYFERRWEPHIKNEELLDFSAGFAGMLCGLWIWTPMDNIIQRCWVTGTAPTAIIRAIATEAGPLGFFSGYPVAAMVWAPLSATFFCAFGFLTRKWEEKTGAAEGGIVPADVVLGSSVVAAAVAAVATNPLDIIKTTFQTAGPGGLAAGPPGEHSMWGVAKRVCRQQGPVGLFTKGLRARAPYVIMDMSLGMFTFDFFFHRFHGEKGGGCDDTATAGA